MDCISSTTTRAPLPLAQRQLALLPYHGVHEVEEGRSHQGSHVPAHRPLGGGDEQDAAVVDGAAHVDGGAALSQDGPRPLGGCVVGEAGLDGSQRLGPVLAVPGRKVPGPPFEEVGVGDLLQDGVAVLVDGQELEAVEDGVLVVLVCGGVLVGLVEGLDGLFEDGLHPRPPLLPEALGHAHHRVGGAVAVGEYPRVEEVDAGGEGLVGQVDEAHPVGDLVGDVLHQPLHQVGVGVDDDDGVLVPARRLLAHLVDVTTWCMSVLLPMRVRAT